MNQFHRLQIDSVVPLTSDSVKISFAIPPELKTDYSFVAGQYLSLKTTINGETVIRDYSICSSPSSGELSVGIKRLNGGIFSGFAQSLKVGEILEVRTPQGRFVLEQNIQTFVGIAAGSGITPIMSLLQHFLEHSTGGGSFDLWQQNPRGQYVCHGAQNAKKHSPRPIALALDLQQN